MVLVGVVSVSAGMVSLGGNEDALSQEMALLEKAVATANKKCLKLEHDAVYTNAVCKVAYSEVKRGEKELHSKRQILVDRLESVPELLSSPSPWQTLVTDLAPATSQGLYIAMESEIEQSRFYRVILTGVVP